MIGADFGAAEIERAKSGREEGEEAGDIRFTEEAVAGNVRGEIEVDEGFGCRVGA